MLSRYRENSSLKISGSEKIQAKRNGDEFFLGIREDQSKSVSEILKI
jgi:hypothetical protein